MGIPHEAQTESGKFPDVWDFAANKKASSQVSLNMNFSRYTPPLQPPRQDRFRLCHTQPGGGVQVFPALLGLGQTPDHPIMEQQKERKYIQILYLGHGHTGVVGHKFIIQGSNGLQSPAILPGRTVGDAQFGSLSRSCLSQARYPWSRADTWSMVRVSSTCLGEILT